MTEHPAPPPEPSRPTAAAVDPEGRPFAAWPPRVIALVIDVVVVEVLFFALDLVFGGTTRVVISAIGLALLLAYFSLLNGSAAGQTAGKWLLGIAVRDMDSGGPIGGGRGFSRAVTQYVLVALFVVPWLVDVLWPLWDPLRQAWHDKAVRSVVVALR